MKRVGRMLSVYTSQGETRFFRAAALFAVAVMLFSGLAGCGSKEFAEGDIRSVEGVYYGTVLEVADEIVAQSPSTGEALTGEGFGKNEYKAQRITARLDTGKILMVVQGFDEYFVKGDRVRVMNMGDGKARMQLASGHGPLPPAVEE